ncbi:hypothetical protein DL89DRAFT_179163 [Linderina pennispora]|uniref:Uncharacterized protein n=1 Tax=Linderina pennispora TaxID=61395 RepID=A0A1Y1W544_9FUNG|nr:uncharacterized protein DL89DRAFT_179163 [Linderina pennispora]ORX68522.1 hypothetical protein DL89DRAFT_179163 [Linderina pennispora]
MLSQSRLACSVAEFLASEILILRPAAIPLPSALDMQAAAKPVRSAATAASGSAVSTAEDYSPDTIAYRCFLIQCLAEMVASFPFTLQAIFVARTSHLLSAQMPRTKDSSKGKMRASTTAPASAGASAENSAQQPALRVRSPLISHLVHDLVVREALNSIKPTKPRARADLSATGTEEEQALAITNQQITAKRGQLSRCVTFWATALLSTICVRHHEGWTTTTCANPRVAGNDDFTVESLRGNYDAALSAARQLVLDHIVRAFRECLSMRMTGIGGADVVYARLTSLAQLTYKLVIARSINHGVPGSARTSGTNSNGESVSFERESANALKKMILERGIPRPADCCQQPAESQLPTEPRDAQQLPAAHRAPFQGSATLTPRMRRWSMTLCLTRASPTRSMTSVATAIWTWRWTRSCVRVGMTRMTMTTATSTTTMITAALTATTLMKSLTVILTRVLLLLAKPLVWRLKTTRAGCLAASLMPRLLRPTLTILRTTTLMVTTTTITTTIITTTIHHHDGDDDDGWESNLSEGELEDLAEIHRLMRHQSGHRHRGAVVGGRGRTLGENLMSIVNSSNIEEFEHALEHHDDDDHDGDDRMEGHGAIGAQPFIGDTLNLDARADLGGASGGDGNGSSSSGSSGSGNDDDEDGDEDDEDEDADSFLDDLPNTFEITMESIDGQPLPSGVANSTDFANFLSRTIRGHLANNRDLANDPIEGLMQIGSGVSNLARSLGSLGAASSGGLGPGHLFPPLGSSLLDMPFPRLTSLGRANHGGGALGGATGHNMSHPMIDPGERTDRMAGADRGLQARADRITRNMMGGPLRTAPDDVYNLGQRLTSQLSQMLSSGRRPVHSDPRILGASNQPVPSALAEEDSAAAKDDTVVNALGDTSSKLVCALQELMQLSRAIAAIEGYTPQSTIERWQEEARMLLSGPASGLTPRLMNALLNRLIPEAIQQNLLRRRYQIEIARRDNIIDRRRMEREDADRKRREEEARAAEELRLEEQAKRAEEQAEEEREMEAKDEAEVPAKGTDTMSLDEPAEQQESGQAAEQQQPEPASEPVFVTVNGQRVDITDTGIDPEFLLALPDDLRMEVIEDRREEMNAESRNNSTGAAGASGGAAGGAASAGGNEENDGISQEFLDALPPEIRQEVLDQQRLQRQLYEREELMRQRMTRTPQAAGEGGSERGGGSSSAATPASQHPATAAALARVGLSTGSRGSRFRVQHLDSLARLGRSGNASSSHAEPSGEAQRLRERRRKKIAARDITVQLLGKPELAALTRFIFLPNHGLSNTLIMKVMQYLCENGATRAQFIQLMLSILGGCALTLADVDKVIQLAIMSGSEAGAAEAPSGRTLPRTGSTISEHQPAGGTSSAVLGTPAVAQFTAGLVQQQNPEYAFPLGDLHADVPAYVPAQRCLDMLHSLAAHNPRASMHFLVEHPLTAKVAVAGDEESRFPLVHLLLLLEKPLFYSHGNTVTELLMQLLATITKPLGSMVKRQQQQHSSSSSSRTSHTSQAARSRHAYRCR